ARRSSDLQVGAAAHLAGAGDDAALAHLGPSYVGIMRLTPLCKFGAPLEVVPAKSIFRSGRARGPRVAKPGVSSPVGSPPPPPGRPVSGSTACCSGGTSSVCGSGSG